IFGEDGELTSRLSRFGYRNEFEPKTIVVSDAPLTFSTFVQQRARWGVAYYHSRGRNLSQAKEFRTPRSIIFLANLIGHGHGFVYSLIFPFLLASILVTYQQSSSLPDAISILRSLLLKIVAIGMLLYTFEAITYVYYLRKLGRNLSDIVYLFPI